MRPYWEQDTYVVVDRPLKNLSVYDVRKLNDTGRVRRLHRILLLLCNNLPVPDSSQETRTKPARRYRKEKPQVIQESSDSSSDVDVIITTPVKQLNLLAKVFTPSSSSASSVQEVPPPTQYAQDVEPIEVSSSFQSANEQRVESDNDNLPAMSTDEESDDRMSYSEETTINDVRTSVRQQPKILTYDTLGQPKIRKCSVRGFDDKKTFELIRIIISYFEITLVVNTMDCLVFFCVFCNVMRFFFGGGVTENLICLI